MDGDAALFRSLAQRVRLFLRLTGLGFAGWQIGNAFTALTGSGLGFLISGIGMGVTIVSLILLAGSTLHARKAGAFDLFKDQAIGPASRSALLALGGAMAVAAGLIAFAQTPQSPLIDLVIAAPVLAFCLHFAQAFDPVADE